MKIKLPTSLTLTVGSSPIPLTGINSSLFQASADQRVMDLSRVGWVTACARNLELTKKVWNRSTESKSAPARDSTFGSVTMSWFCCGFRKTHQIYEPCGFIDRTITVMVSCWKGASIKMEPQFKWVKKMIIVSVHFNDCDLLIWREDLQISISWTFYTEQTY